MVFDEEIPSPPKLVRQSGYGKSKYIKNAHKRKIRSIAPPNSPAPKRRKMAQV